MLLVNYVLLTPGPQQSTSSLEQFDEWKNDTAFLKELLYSLYNFTVMYGRVNNWGIWEH